MKSILNFVGWGLFLFAFTVKANVCGTDYQNFNPTTGGLDFVTVHSSETLRPCYMNVGFFSNYAVNTLTYARTVSNLIQAGGQPNDRILGIDSSVGFGLARNWDFGISVPFVANQEFQSPSAASYFEKSGATEVRVNTKYRVFGSDRGGGAVIFSVNHNLIENNPFAGEKPGPTYNLEAALDHSLGDWALAVNGGYRKRNPGPAIVGQPFIPFKDQYIYSIAGSFHMPSLDTKLILEYFAAQAVNSTDEDLDQSLRSGEALAGLKIDLNQNVAFNFGGGAEVFDSVGSPDWRVYFGVNVNTGPFCSDSQKPTRVRALRPTKPVPEFEEAMQELETQIVPVEVAEVGAPTLEFPSERAETQQEPAYPISTYQGQKPDETIRFSAEVLFNTDSDKIKRNALPELDQLVSDLRTNGFRQLVVEGHTDSIGSESYNQSLSERRAKNVASFIEQVYNIEKSKLDSKGFGEKRPVGDNGNFQGREKNRRVEFLIWR